MGIFGSRLIVSSPLADSVEYANTGMLLLVVLFCFVLFCFVCICLCSFVFVCICSHRGHTFATG